MYLGQSSNNINIMDTNNNIFIIDTIITRPTTLEYTFKTSDSILHGYFSVPPLLNVVNICQSTDECCTSWQN
jgi:hypothetical protein